MDNENIGGYIFKPVNDKGKTWYYEHSSKIFNAFYYHSNEELSQSTDEFHADDEFGSSAARAYRVAIEAAEEYAKQVVNAIPKDRIIPVGNTGGDPSYRGGPYEIVYYGAGQYYASIKLRP